MSEINILLGLIKEYGLSTVIVAYLIYWMTKKLDNSLHEILETLQRIEKKLR